MTQQLKELSKVNISIKLWEKRISWGLEAGNNTHQISSRAISVDHLRHMTKKMNRKVLNMVTVINTSKWEQVFKNLPWKIWPTPKDIHRQEIHHLDQIKTKKISKKVSLMKKWMLLNYLRVTGSNIEMDLCLWNFQDNRIWCQINIIISNNLPKEAETWFKEMIYMLIINQINIVNMLELINGPKTILLIHFHHY